MDLNTKYAQTKKQHRNCIKIPTIVNGRITHSDDRNLTAAKKKTTHVSGTNCNNKDHKVKIVGDNHLRGTATRVDQYLNTIFGVCIWIKQIQNN